MLRAQPRRRARGKHRWQPHDPQYSGCRAGVDSAQVRLVTARRNAYVAGFSLLAAMGRAEARDLGLEGGALYDAQVNYDRVRNKWFDWDDDPAPQANATRTIETVVQDGEVSR